MSCFYWSLYCVATSFWLAAASTATVGGLAAFLMTRH